MKAKWIVALLLSTALLASPLYAGDDDDRLTFETLVSHIDSVTAPYVTGDYAVFTAEHNARFVGIAFDYENFSVIHPMQIRTIYDYDFNPVDSLYFFILKLPKTVQDINYRLVIDGLWTTDPLNANKTYSRQAGLYLSHLDASRTVPAVTEKINSNTVRFTYRGAKGQQVRLGGSFTNWDSWIYTLTETSPGVYEIDIPLAPGKYEYAFYTGIQSTPDPSNPERVYTADGRIASLLIVQ